MTPQHNGDPVLLILHPPSFLDDMPAAVRLFSGLLLFLLSWVSLSVSAQETVASLKDGYYFVKNARTAENALYIGRPRIPRQLPGAAFNKDPMRACWTFNTALPFPNVFEDDALFYLFKVTRISDDGLYTFQNVGSERFLACTEREGASLPTITFVFDDAFFYVERDAADRNYVNLVSFKLLDRPNNAVSASEHNNGVVMASTADWGARWLLIPVDDRHVRR